MHVETRKLSRFLLYLNTINTRIPFVLIDVDAEGTVSIYFVSSPSSVLEAFAKQSLSTSGMP
jgi:hypothetical protein